MSDLRWRLRVLWWRLLPFAFLMGCAHTADAANAIAERCVASIAAAPDEATARTIAADCHHQIEGLR